MSDNRANPPIEESSANVSETSRPIDRRGYLKRTGALAGVPLAANSGAGTVVVEENTDENDDEPAAPTNLRVEYAREPNNALPSADARSTPRFTWEVTGPRSVTQSAYRILVADGPTPLENGRATVWDSGRIESSQSIHIPYEGELLEADTTYYWAVCVWNEAGLERWSDISRFTTALPRGESHWEGEWIGAESAPGSDDPPGSEWSDYALDIQFTLVESAAGFVFRATDEDNLYMWQVDSSRLRPHKRVDGSWEALDEIAIDDVFEGEGVSQRIQIAVSGTEIETRINGEAIDSRTDDTFSSGTIGFRQPWNEQVRVESVTVTAPDGEPLFEDEFDQLLVENFDGGAIRDGALELRGNHVVLLGEAHDRPAPLLRRAFDLEGELESARLHISGLGYYELHLNGERVGERVLDPGTTDYERTVLYSSYDVADELREGANALGVVLGRGRFGELVENEWNWNDVGWWSDPQLRLQLNVTFADGTRTSIVTDDDDWRVTDGPIRFDSLFEGEIHDARKEKPGWSTVDYDDSEWERPSVVDSPGGDVVAQRLQPIAVSDVVEPVSVDEPRDDVYVFDMGELLSGWTELTVDGPEGTVVKLVHGEQLRDDGTVNNDNNSLPFPMRRDAYTLGGDGTETWEPRFTYGGFRYVQVEGYPGIPSPEDVRAKVVHSAIDEGNASGFESSNELLDRIHENARRAYLNNMHGVPTDTPTYEKNGWTGDALVTAETGMYNFDMARFWRKWLRDCRDAQARAADIGAGAGNLPVIVPSSGFGYDDYWTPDPGWQSALVLIPWWGYEIYGDERLLEENYGAITQYLEYLRRYADDHVVREGLGDWAAPGGRWPPAPAADIISTCFYYRDVQVASRAAAVLGYEDDAAEYQQLSDRIRTALNEEYLDEDAGYYRSRERDGDDWLDEYRQTDNVLPLAFEMVPEAHEDAVVANLVHDVMDTHDGHLNTGLHGTKYLLPVLSEYGHHDAAYAVATRTDYPSWGNWIENDATALLELWSPEESRSYSHHFLGSIDEWFYRHLAGIQVAEPGFSHIRIAPKPVDDLEWTSGQVDTVRGTVESSWELVETPGAGRDSRGIELDATIPGNATATVEIPTLGGERVRVRERGKTIWNDGNRTRPNHPGIEGIERTDEHVVVEVGSGEYAFDLEQLGT